MNIELIAKAIGLALIGLAFMSFPVSTLIWIIRNSDGIDWDGVKALVVGVGIVILATVCAAGDARSQRH